MNYRFIIFLECIVLLSVIALNTFVDVDWRTYMHQINIYLKGESDYDCILGSTGPLVYPPGFIWLFAVLRFVTRGGIDTMMAQCIFAAVYLATLGIALRWYRAARVPLVFILCLFCSKRIRSLYVLRMFNDCWCVFFAYVGVALLTSSISRRRPSKEPFGQRFLYNDRRWYLGCLFMSIGISIKMNIMLFLPGLLCILLHSIPFLSVVICVAVGASWHVFVAFPFLSTYPDSYMHKSFEINRVFKKIYSVNYQYLPTSVFESPFFHSLLCGLMLAAYAALWRRRWAPRCRRVVEEVGREVCGTEAKSAVESSLSYASSVHSTRDKGVEILDGRKVSREKAGNTSLSSVSVATGPPPSLAVFRPSDTTESNDVTTPSFHFQSICMPHVLTLLESNFIGVAFSRSLHYQFYSWIFFSILLVLHWTRLPTIVSIFLFAAIQYSFEAYPPTKFSSAMLTTAVLCSVFSIVFLGDEKNNKTVKATKIGSKGKKSQ